MRALLLLALAACSDGTYLVVTVSARPTVHDVATLSVTQANNGTSRTDSLALGDHTLPATFSISTDGRTGALDLKIDAKDEAGTTVALGAVTAMATDSDATLQLDPADFVVNTDYAKDEFLTTDFETVGYQLAATSDNKFTAVFRNTCTDTCNVFARTFGSDGLPVRTAAAAGTNQYTISSATTQDLAYPAIASAGTSSIAVWDFTDTVGGGVGIACRGIDATGALTAGQRTLSTDAADTATVTALPTGNYAVSWQVYAPASAIHTIIAKPDCTTLATTPAVVSNVASTSGPYRSSVAANDTTVLWAWIAADTVHVRSGSTTAAFTLPESTVTPTPAGMQATAVRVAPMGAGFAIGIRYISKTPGMPGQLVLVRTTTTGLIQGTPKVVSNSTGSDFTNGRRGFGIATRADGQTLMVWAQCDDGSPGACDGRLDVYGNLMSATSDPVPENAFMIPTTTVGSQTDPSVVALSDAFAVAWNDDSKASVDTDGTAVRARVIYP